MPVKSKNRSDMAILVEMYEMYLPTFLERANRPNGNPQDKVYVPIDVDVLAKKLSMNRDVLWGRLYYHLDQKHGYERDGAKTHLFAKQVGTEHHCINFPLVSALAAEREHELRRYLLPVVIAMSGVILSVLVNLIKH